MFLFFKKTKPIANTNTEAEQVKTVASMMIEAPMDLIRQILQNHEERVLEVMREMDVDNRQLREALTSLITVARNHLPNSDHHPEVKKATAALVRLQPSKEVAL